MPAFIGLSYPPVPRPSNHSAELHDLCHVYTQGYYSVSAEGKKCIEESTQWNFEYVLVEKRFEETTQSAKTVTRNLAKTEKQLIHSLPTRKTL